MYNYTNKERQLTFILAKGELIRATIEGTKTEVFEVLGATLDECKNALKKAHGLKGTNEGTTWAIKNLEQNKVRVTFDTKTIIDNAKSIEIVND